MVIAIQNAMHQLRWNMDGHRLAQGLKNAQRGVCMKVKMLAKPNIVVLQVIMEQMGTVQFVRQGHIAHWDRPKQYHAHRQSLIHLQPVEQVASSQQARWVVQHQTKARLKSKTAIFQPTITIDTRTNMAYMFGTQIVIMDATVM